MHRMPESIAVKAGPTSSVVATIIAASGNRTAAASAICQPFWLRPTAGLAIEVTECAVAPPKSSNTPARIKNISSGFPAKRSARIP